jgi:hypothetical protein
MRNTTVRISLLLALCACAFAQTTQSDAPNWLLTTGIGYKPYQTTIKAGSSAFIEGGKLVSLGVYAFTRLDARSTDAQMVFEGCKTLFSAPNVIPMLCGGPGFGADANNVGMALSAGGKLFYRVTKFTTAKGRVYGLGDNTWLYVSVTVDRNNVPAPVSVNGGIINPVQPDFRFGISKTF